MSLNPLIVKLILDRVATSELQETYTILLWPIAAYFGLIILYNVNFRFWDFICLRLFPNLKAEMTTALTAYTSQHSYSYFQNNFAGSLVNKIKDIAKGVESTLQIVIDRFLSHFLALIFACITLATVHPLIGLILFVWACAFISFSFWSMRRTVQLSHRFSQAVSQVVGDIVDQLSNIVNVRLFARNGYEDRYLRNRLATTVERDIDLQWFRLNVASIRGGLIFMMAVSCILVLVWGRKQGLVSVGDFGLVFVLLGTISQAFWLLASEFATYAETYGQMKQGLVIIEESHEIQDVIDAKQLQVTKGNIVFDQVNFQYPDSSPLFAGKSITLSTGQKVGLVGYSGSGKSTFVNLILRLFDVQSGQILIDGQDISKCTQDSLREQIAMIPQDPVLFHRTLKENIGYGKIEATESEIIQAAKQAHAHEFISELSQQYESLVGERGVKLSGGQRQRIAVARAILKNVPILILDEATSALDSVTEQYIQQSLHELMQDRTTIVIAHRLSTLAAMDRILVFDKGQIIEDGPHEKLLKAKGHYAKMWQMQAQGFLPDEEGNTE